MKKLVVFITQRRKEKYIAGHDNAGSVLDGIRRAINE